MARTPQLSAKALRVLNLMKARQALVFQETGRKEFSFPYSAIQEQAGLSRPTISRAIAELVEHHCIARIPYVKNGKNIRSHHLYVLTDNRRRWFFCENILPIIRKVIQSNLKSLQLELFPVPSYVY